MDYELSPYPFALFKDGEIRKTTKATFYDLFPEVSVDVNDVQKFSYIMDGMMLLHRCKWHLEETYGHNIYVVFDGYNKNCTKLVERMRRCKKMYVMT